MKKIMTSLACPFCMAEGSNIISKPIDTYENKKQENSNIMNIKRVYVCHCSECNRDYQVDYGYALLTRYIPYTYVTDDVKLYVDYESEFDRSYKIAEVDGISMIILEDDSYPLIIEDDKKQKFIESHEKTKKYTYNEWMNRYR